MTRAAGLAIEMYGMGCAIGDYDNDGYPDIYITAVGSNHLFHNLGNGKFADVTAKAGVGDPGFSTSAVWFDYDNDGKLDLFVSHYVDWSVAKDQYCSLDGKNKSYCTPQAYKGKVHRSFTIRATEHSKTSPSERDYTIRPANHWALRWWTMTMMAGSIFLWPTTRSRTSCIATITMELLPMLRFSPAWR